MRLPEINTTLFAKGIGHLKSVPVISLKEEGLGFADALGQAFEEVGFAVIIDHGIDAEEIDAVYAAMNQVFDYTDDQLLRYKAANGQDGFFPFQQEKARDQPRERADLKRMWHTFRPGENPNVWPEEVPDFQLKMEQMFARLDALAFRLLAALDVYLGHKNNELVRMVEGGRTLLRSIHYPVVKDNPGGAVRSSPHTDINLITLLKAATGSGLKVQARDGTWYRVNETHGSIVVNVGDMLQLLTARRPDRRMISTVHAVENDDLKEERFSAPFFVHPRAEIVLDEETGYTAGKFLPYRLVEIGLIEGDLDQMEAPPIIPAA